MTITYEQFAEPFSPLELEEIKKFWYEHCVTHKHGNDFNIKIRGGGIGHGATIICKHCGKKKDITDYGRW